MPVELPGGAGSKGGLGDFLPFIFLKNRFMCGRRQGKVDADVADLQSALLSAYRSTVIWHTGEKFGAKRGFLLEVKAG